MSKFYIICWNRKGWKQQINESITGQPFLKYAASDRFIKAGVCVGDTLIIINIKNGELRLGGYIKVAELGNELTAATRLGVNTTNLWPAGDYAIASEHELCEFIPHKVVPNSVVESLLLVHSNSGFKSPVTDRNGVVDPQTFRVPRQLVLGEEHKLMELLR